MHGRDLIVIGGSAGAVEALGEMLGGIPSTLRGTLLVSIHRSSTLPGTLPRLLERRGRLPAQYAADGDVYVHGRIYVAPPDHHLLVSGERLRVTRGPREHGLRPAVDPLFRSAARELGPRVVGIVLSGVLDDGTDGLAVIKRHDGVAIVQRTEDVRHVDMPAAALERVDVDHVLPAAAIGAVLTRLVDEVAVAPASPGTKDTTEGAGPGAPAAGLAQPITCPECGGALRQSAAKRQRHFRCHGGHAFTARTLAALHDGRFDQALWSARRNLEESAAFRCRLARAKGRGLPEVAALYEAQAGRAQERAKMLRALLDDADAIPRSTTLGEEMEQVIPTAHG